VTKGAIMAVRVEASSLASGAGLESVLSTVGFRHGSACARLESPLVLNMMIANVGSHCR
jgi:hypothetical protein